MFSLCVCLVCAYGCVFGLSKFNCRAHTEHSGRGNGGDTKKVKHTQVKMFKGNCSETCHSKASGCRQYTLNGLPFRP